MKKILSPNAEGLFTVAGIRNLAKRRDCEVSAVKPTGCIISGAFTETVLVFDQLGLCGPHQIYAACTIAAGRRLIPARRCQTPAALDKSSHGLDEPKLAELLGSDGIEPYRAKRRTVAFESLIRSTFARGAIAFAAENKYVKAAARCVVDAGYADVALGPRGGWQEATLTWRELARPRLSVEEDTALIKLNGAPADR